MVHLFKLKNTAVALGTVATLIVTGSALAASSSDTAPVRVAGNGIEALGRARPVGADSVQMARFASTAGTPALLHASGAAIERLGRGAYRHSDEPTLTVVTRDAGIEVFGRR